MIARAQQGSWHRRAHVPYLAFLAHRISGVLLALFLPLHFWALGQAIQGEAALDGFLAWADRPWVKLAETGIVVALSVHLAGGLRLIALEFLLWREWQKTAAAIGLGFGLALGLLYLFNAGLGR
ncbi:MAG: succinate dehydrogenase, cytochrome b556 subunit [Proteobacteria bacterium]|nr:succinate dehydrogenase, cytochrome b556 subunit [Pseudomonadota bacterium]